MIYISHIHPDHYDIHFLKKYFKKYGLKKIIISERNKTKDFLKQSITDKFNAIIINKFKKDKNFEIQVIESEPNSKLGIDSCLLINDFKLNKSILNLNDCIYSKDLSQRIKKQIPLNFEIATAFLPYSGANSFPHTYVNYSKNELKKQIKSKENFNLNRFKKFVKDLDPKIIVPFAGKYYLGSTKKLIDMNNKRGIIDPLILKNNFKNVVIPNDGGSSYIDIIQEKCTSERLHLYDYNLIKKYLLNNLKKIDQSDADNLNINNILRNSIIKWFNKVNKLNIDIPEFYILYFENRTNFIGYKISVKNDKNINLVHLTMNTFKSINYGFLFEKNILLKVLMGKLNWNESFNRIFIL